MFGLLAACSATQPTTVCRAPVCAPAQSAYAIEVAPPTRSVGLGSIDLTDVQFDATTGALVVSLPSLVTLSGSVTLAGKPLAGSIVAKRAARITGRPDLTAQATLDKNGAYSVSVPPTLAGELYEVRFVPTDLTEVPPENLTSAATTDTELDFKLTATHPRFMAGMVLDVLGNPVKGMQVQALDPVDGRVVSTTLTTGSDGGYNLAFSTTWKGSMTRLVASPTADAPTGTPTLTSQVMLGASGATLNLAVPALPRIGHFTYRVVGVGTSGAQSPVVGAHCQFVATVSPSAANVTALYQVDALTDNDGQVGVDLIPSDATAGNRMYDVTISPPSDSNFASQESQIGVGPTGGYGAPVQLQIRPTASGRVIDQHGLPVAAVTVQPGLATVAQVEFAPSLAALNKLTTTMTEADGRFALRLDVGQYDLAFIPPAAKLLPRLWMDLGTLTGDSDRGDVVLPPGVMVRTVVVDPSGQPVEGAGIQLFIVPAPTCGGSDSTCARTPRVLVDTASGSDGSAEMLLPAQ